MSGRVNHPGQFSARTTPLFWSVFNERQQEQAKISLLKAKIAECERRVEVLKSFLNADELDTLLSKSLEHEGYKGQAKAVGAPVQPSVSDDQVFELPKRRLSDDVQSILRFIGSEGKTLDQMEAFCSSKGLSHTRGTLRSLASNYKTKHGFLVSPKLGYFQLTEQGLSFLNANYPVVQSETPSVGAEGVSDTSTETAATRTDSDGLI